MSTQAPEWLESSKQYTKEQEAMGCFLRHLKRGENNFLFDHKLRAKLIADGAIESTSKANLTSEAAEIACTKLGLEVTVDTTYGEAAEMFMTPRGEDRKAEKGKGVLTGAL